MTSTPPFGLDLNVSLSRNADRDDEVAINEEATLIIDKEAMQARDLKVSEFIGSDSKRRQLTISKLFSDLARREIRRRSIKVLLQKGIIHRPVSTMALV